MAFDDAQFTILREHLVDGGSLRSFCRQYKVGATTVLDWVEATTARQELYARARAAQAEAEATEIVGISDNSDLTPDDRRVRIDARKWAAAKLRPRVYGERVRQENTGPDGGPMVTEVVYRWSSGSDDGTKNDP